MKDPKQLQIASLALFSECKAADVRWIASHADSLTLGPRSELATAGTYVREFIVILDGVASSGDVVFGRGSFIGDFESVTHARTIEAMTDVTVLVFGYREFRGLEHRLPSVAATIRKSAVSSPSPAGRLRRSGARLPSRGRPTQPSAA